MTQPVTARPTAAPADWLELDAYDLAPPVEPFALAGAGVNNATCGLRTGAGSLVAKHYQTHADQAALDYEHRLLRLLAEAALPFAVPAPLTTRAEHTCAPAAGGWLALFPLLPGAAPDPRDPAAAEQIGDALGRLHGALAALPAAPHPTMCGSGELRSVHPLVPDPAALALGGAAWWRAELDAVAGFAGGAYRALPRQLIHGDFCPANTLFDAGRLTAVIDFEMALPDARALDVASGVYFTLRPWEAAPSWQAMRALCRGYARQVRLTPAEVAALPALMRLRNLVALIWHAGQERRLGRGPDRPGWRLAKTQATNTWLATHGAALVAAAAEACERHPE